MMTTDKTLPEFSFFPGPITNIWPKANATIVDVYRGITADYYKKKTEQLRKSKNPDQYRKAKKALDYCTFGGTFWTRDKSQLIKPSGYCTIDIDHIRPNFMINIQTILQYDPMIETALLFISPSGTGLKWIVKLDLEIYPDYELNYRGIVGYLKATYPDHFSLKENIIDESGKDICRACFLCHDQHAYINPKYLANGNGKV